MRLVLSPSQPSLPAPKGPMGAEGCPTLALFFEEASHETSMFMYVHWFSLKSIENYWNHWNSIENHWKWLKTLEINELIENQWISLRIILKQWKPTEIIRHLLKSLKVHEIIKKSMKSVKIHDTIKNQWISLKII